MKMLAWCIIVLSVTFGHGVICLALQGIKYSLPQVPAGVAAASHQLQALAVPAAVVQIATKLWRLRLIRQRRRRKPAKSTAASQGILTRGPDQERICVHENWTCLQKLHAEACL